MDEKETKRGFGDGAGDDADESPEANAVVEDSERIDADVSKLAADLGELQRMLVRRQADFDNYRKRIERERSDDSRRATARVIEGLIPVLDGFEQALAAHNEPAYEGFRKGFELIYKQMLDNLTKLGLERLDPSGERFDPHFHQAVDRLETREHPDGTILQVFQPGYVFHGRVLRPALVRVAVHKEGSAKSQVN
jgi:molecular chaperone GrpE